MKIAIIGAGLAGLSCAIVLEKHGIIPTVFEKTGFIGDREPHVAASLHIVNRPTKNILEHIRKNYDINITPLNTINKLTHYSPNEKTAITGNFGYFTRRDKEEGSFKGQLFAQIEKTKVNFNTAADYMRLSEEFDHVVVADGKPNIAKELGCWTDWLHGRIKGAVVKGRFNPNELVMWINKNYCKNGYAYMTPFDSGKASLLLFVPNVSEQELEYYWDLFLRKERINVDIVETYIVKHGSGKVYPRKIKNIFLVGTAGGAIDPFLGFGQMKSIAMGGMAAKALVEGRDFEAQFKPFSKTISGMYSFRKAFDELDNNKYDKIVKALRFPGVKPIVYDTPLNVIKYGAMAANLKQKITRKK